jgi:hypothetical protein
VRIGKSATENTFSIEWDSDRPRIIDALGLDVFDLASALRSFAVDELERVTATVRRGDERPNLGRFRRLLRAAEVCEAAWDEMLAVATEDDDE